MRLRYSLFLIVSTQLKYCLQVEKACEECLASTKNLFTIFDKSNKQMKQISDQICFEEQSCSRTLYKFVRAVKVGRAEMTLEPEALCRLLAVCPNPAAIKVKARWMEKFFNVLLILLSNVLTLVETESDQWKPVFCQKCYDQLKPLTQYFVDNGVELFSKVRQLCKSLEPLNIEAEECNTLADNWIASFRRTKTPVCNLTCKAVDPDEKLINKDKLSALEMEEKRDAEYRIEKVASIADVVIQNKELFPYVMSREGDVNAFCTMCIDFSSRIADFQEKIADALSSFLSTTIFDTLRDAKKESAYKTILKTVNLNLDNYLNVLKNPTVCKSRLIMACSAESYQRVEMVLKTTVGYRTICSSCKSFFKYLGPILTKPSTQTDLANYFFKQLTKLIPANVLDYVNIDMSKVVGDVVTHISDYVNNNSSCSLSPFCAEEPEGGVNKLSSG